MAEYRYRTEAGGPERIHVCITMFPRNIRVTFDGAEVLTFANRLELVAGKTATLADQSTLRVALGPKALPIVQLHGKVLAESGYFFSSGASSTFYFIGGWILVLGGLGSATGVTWLAAYRINWPSATLGLFISCLDFSPASIVREFQ